MTADGFEYAFYAAWGRSPSEVWLVGESGSIWFWNGSTLAQQTSPTTSTLRALWGRQQRLGGRRCRHHHPLRRHHLAQRAERHHLSPVRHLGQRRQRHLGRRSLGHRLLLLRLAVDLRRRIFGRTDGHRHLRNLEERHLGGDERLGSAGLALRRHDVARNDDPRRHQPQRGAGLQPDLGRRDQPDRRCRDLRRHHLAGRHAQGRRPALFGLWGSSATDYVAVGNRSQIVRVRGRTPTVLTKGKIDNIVAIWGASEMDYWIFTEGKLARRVRGTVATEYSLPSEPLSVAGRAADDIWVGSHSGKLLHWDGSTWSTLTTLATGHINYIASVSSDRLVLSAAPTASSSTTACASSPATAACATARSGQRPVRHLGRLWHLLCQYRRFDGMKRVSGYVSGCVFSSSEITAIHGSSASNVYLATNYNSYVYRYNGSGFETVPVRNARAPLCRTPPAPSSPTITMSGNATAPAPRHGRPLLRSGPRRPRLLRRHRPRRRQLPACSCTAARNRAAPAALLEEVVR